MTHKYPDNRRRALFPGSFNPFTVGHQSLVERGLDLFDEVIVAVGVSYDKMNVAQIDERVKAISDLFAGEPRVRVMSYTGLTIDLARECGAGFILRGIRNSADFEYERNMADVNRALSGVETVLLPTLPELSMVSSSVVRELQYYGRDVSSFLPRQKE